MKTEWIKEKDEVINIKCPTCGHQAAPPEYPYCMHTLFVFVEPYADNHSFDYMREDFRKAWECLNKKSKPTIKVLSSMRNSSSCLVYDMTEQNGYYPTRIVVGYERLEAAPNQPF